MKTISYESLATQNDTNERETARPISGEIQLTSLAAYMAEHLCPVQQATRSTLVTPLTPPSGRGSNRETIRVLG
jgi:hypothetical protein